MPPHQRTLEALEWDLIRQGLADRTRSPLGAELARQHAPLDSPAASQRLRLRVLEAQLLVRTSPVHGYLADTRDPHGFFERASREGVLKPDELWSCGHFMTTVGLVGEELRARGGQTPLWAKDFELTPKAPPVCERIARSVSSTGEILDSASPELARLRRARIEKKSEFESNLNQKVKDWYGRGLLQDDFYDVMDGRYVVPVKVEQQSKMGGVLLGKSNTGQSVFVEPAELTVSNNALKEIELSIRAEEFRILRQLSQEVGAHADSFVPWVSALAELDLALAAARLADDWELQPPQVAGDGQSAGELKLLQAFHPGLKLQKINIVRNSLSLGGEGAQGLLISGPNTGGKTVLLKAVALSACMANAGLLIPAEPGSTLPHYRNILAFIGDEQDLSAGLSSFSAQIMDMNDVLARTGAPFLIVIDEMLSSTDPEEASALAQALIEEFVERGHHVIVTSHFSELSLRCRQNPKIAVAAMEFDGQRPTYRLRPDELGSSHALDIAKRLGIPPRILERAKGLMSTAKLDYERAVADLKKKEDQLQQELDRERASFEHEKKRLRDEFNTRLSDYVAAAEKKLGETVQALTQRINTYVRQGIGGLRPSHFGKKTEEKLSFEADRALAEVQAGAAELKGESRPTAGPAAGLAPGAAVKVRSMRGVRGTVLALKHLEGSPISATVQVGNFRWERPIEDLEPIAGQPKQTQRLAYFDKGLLDMEAIPTKLDLRGRRYDEAIAEAQQYLDRAFRSGAMSVTVVTGHGTGALKKGLKDLLAGLPYVRDYHPERTNDDGATVVEFDR